MEARMATRKGGQVQTVVLVDQAMHKDIVDKARQEHESTAVIIRRWLRLGRKIEELQSSQALPVIGQAREAKEAC
jgi:hypothetical protein